MSSGWVARFSGRSANVRRGSPPVQRDRNRSIMLVAKMVVRRMPVAPLATMARAMSPARIGRRVLPAAPMTVASRLEWVGRMGLSSKRHRKARRTNSLRRTNADKTTKGQEIASKDRPISRLQCRGQTTTESLPRRPLQGESRRENDVLSWRRWAEPEAPRGHPIRSLKWYGRDT